MRTAESTLDRPPTDPRPRATRSAVSNGRRTFVEGDGKSAWARRRQDLLELHLDDMGGRDSLTEAQVSLASRAAAIEVELEQLDGQLSKGESVDLDVYCRAASHLRRILETIGIERVSKDVTPSLADIVARHRAAEAKEATA